MTEYQNTLQTYIETNMPDATVGDVLGTKQIIDPKIPFLPNSLPMRQVKKLTTFADVPDGFRHKIRFSISNPDPYAAIYDEESAELEYETTTIDLASKRITLSYAPATPEDEAYLQSLAEQESTSIPAYLVEVKPELKIDGQIVAEGGKVGLGEKEEFLVTVLSPNYLPSTIRNDINVGAFYGVALNLGNISEKSIRNIKSRIENISEVFNQNPALVTKDDTIGEMLTFNAQSYFLQLDHSNEIIKNTTGIENYRILSIGFVLIDMDVLKFFGIPKSARAKGLAVDIDRNVNLTISKKGDIEKEKVFTTLSDLQSSMLEHTVLEQYYSAMDTSVEAVSAIKVISEAVNQNIPVYTMDKNNINQILPLLQISSDIKSDITNSINAGLAVIIPEVPITVGGLETVGYIISDPDTGGGAYMIETGFSGGQTQLPPECLNSPEYCLEACDTILQAKFPLLKFINPLGILTNLLLQIGFDIFRALAKSHDACEACKISCYIEFLTMAIGAIITAGVGIYKWCIAAGAVVFAIGIACGGFWILYATYQIQQAGKRWKEAYQDCQESSACRQ